MFRFEEPDFFRLFVLIPLLLLAYLAYRWWRTRQWKRFATDEAARRLQSTRSAGRELIRTVLIFAGFTFLILAFTNPQWGYRKEEVKQTSTDIYIALDISSSMLAEDVAPSRLERAKHIAIRVAEAFRTERIALILFAGNAYLQTPLTTDYAAVQLFIRAAHPGQASTQGTSFADAIDLVMKAHREEETSRLAILFLTDGENHEEGALEVMQEASERGIVPLVIAVGTENGGQIPLQSMGRNDVKRDRQGNPVISRLNTDFLQKLAAAGNGEILSYRQEDQIIPSLRRNIESLEKREMEARSFTDFESYFQYFLIFALCCFVAEHLIGERHARKQFMSALKWK